MARPPDKDGTPKPRPSRGRSGRLAPPPAETAAGTPTTKGFAEAPQSAFEPEGPVEIKPTLPALRQQGPLPPRAYAGEAMGDTLNALLAKPAERSERAREILARQPMLATHPLVSGGMPAFLPHRPERPEKSEGGHRFKLVSEFEPKGDQPTAIADLVKGVGEHERDAGAARRHRLGQDLHHGARHRRDAAPGADPGAEQDARRPALRRDEELLSRQRGRVLRLLLRLLPAGGLRPAHRHLYREGSRRSTSRSTACATAATRALLERDDVIIVASVSCIYGIGSVETYTAMTFAVKLGERHLARSAARGPRGAALPAQRRGLRARQFPRARRHRRGVPGPLRGPRLAHLALRRRGRERSPSSTR